MSKGSVYDHIIFINLPGVFEVSIMGSNQRGYSVLSDDVYANPVLIV